MAYFSLYEHFSSTPAVVAVVAHVNTCLAFVVLSHAVACRDRLFAEIRVLKQLKHKNIMTFYDSWLDQKTYSVNFITEMFTSGTLRQYAATRRTAVITLLLV